MTRRDFLLSTAAAGAATGAGVELARVTFIDPKQGPIHSYRLVKFRRMDGSITTALDPDREHRRDDFSNKLQSFITNLL